VVVSPFGPVKVKTLPVLASKVLVSECPRALVVLTGNLPSVEYSTDVLLPYFEDEQRYFVTTEYDAIGRLISTTKPADEGKTATSSTSYNGLSTTTTNAPGHQKTTTLWSPCRQSLRRSGWHQFSTTHS
jgi:hypothetical protein